MSDNEFKDSLKVQEIQRNLQKEGMALLDQYEESNSFESREFLCYLTSAIYLTTKRLFPQLNIYIPFRTKSDISYMKNIKKEFPKAIMKSQDLTEDLDLSSLQKDISGIRLVLDDINDSRPATGESAQILNDPEIQKLSPFYKENPKDISSIEFIKEVESYLYSPIKSSKEYYRLRKDLLGKILEATPKEFTQERMPQVTFKKLYEDTCYEYEYFKKIDEFPPITSADELELSELLDDYRSRSNDKYHFAILRKVIPIILNDPLIKNALKVSPKYEKESKKPNAFQSLYYVLESPFGPIELQAQSNKAYYAATKGSAYHSGMNGKTVNIKNLFELVDPNDEHDIAYYLDKLDSTSADTLISSYELPEFDSEAKKQKFFTTPEGIKYLNSEKCREMMTHIQMKKQVQILSATNNPEELYDRTGNIDQKKLQARIDSGEKINITTMDTNEYLLSTALSLSPYMNVCSSGHTSTTTSTIHHKKLIGEFAEILRKKDSNTCLREILIRRLERLIEDKEFVEESSYNEHASNSIKDMVKTAKKHEKIASKLPRDISRKNILNYAEKLKKKIDKNSNNSRNTKSSSNELSL